MFLRAVDTAVLPPQELRAAVVALRAFNVETAQVAEQVRQAGLVPIRFQWWRDAVNSCYRGPPVKHPVVQALAQARVASPAPSGLGSETGINRRSTALVRDDTDC